MANILGNVRKFIAAPETRGVLGAAAMGANPLLGLLAAPALRSRREKQDLARERFRLENEAARKALKDKQRQREAVQRLQTMLGDFSMVQGPGSTLNLESVSGPSTPVSVPGRKAMVPMLSTGEGRQEALGLLADAAPDQFGGILGRQLFPQEQSRALPRDVEAAIAADPQFLSRPGVAEALRERALNPQGDIQTQLDATRALIQRLELEAKSQELEAADEEQRRNKARVRTSISGDLKRAREAIDLQQDLAQTALSSGLPFADFMSVLQAGGSAIAERFGFDAERARELVAKRDRLRKLFSSNVIQSIPTLGELGGLTNDKLELIRASSPSLENQPEANALLFADQLGFALQGAEIAGIDIPNRGEIEAFMEDIRTNTFSRPKLEDIPGWDDLTTEEQAELRAALEARDGQ